MAFTHSYVDGELIETITYTVLHKFGDYLIMDEAPWTCHNVGITEACAPNGDGLCDGYSEDGSCDCHCACHNSDRDMGTYPEVKAYHDRLWATQPVDFEA